MFHQIPPLNLRELHIRGDEGQSEWKKMDDSKDTLSSSHNRHGIHGIHINSQRLWHRTQVQSECVPLMNGVSGCESPHLSKKLSAADTHLQRKKLSFLTEYINHTSGWPHTQQKMANTKQTQSCFYRLFISYCSVWIIFV